MADQLNEARPVDAPAGGLPCGQQLVTRAIGERLGPYAPERVVVGAQVFARVHAPVLATQPLAIHEVGSDQVNRNSAAAESPDRLAEKGLRHVAVAQERG
jgi:hypothetical protein